MYGAALDRHVGPQARERRLEALAAVDNHQLWLGHATGQQIVEHGPPGGFGLAAHVLDREHHLLAVAADAEGNQQGNGRGPPIEPDLDHSAVQDQPDEVVAGQITFLPGLPGGAGFLPGATDDVLADVALEQLREGAAHPAGVHPGEIGLGDQGLGAAAEASVGRQQRALPFLLAIVGVQTRPRHRQAQRAEGGDQLARPVPVAAAVRDRAALITPRPSAASSSSSSSCSINERTWERTAASKGSNQSLPANGDGADAHGGVASFMAWVPSRSCRSEPTPPQPISTNLATRPRGSFEGGDAAESVALCRD